MKSYRVPPAISNGYALGPWFSVIVPIARTNLVTNPSFETNTTSWTAIGGSIARSTAQQYHGAYSLAITPSSATIDGARYDTVSLTSGTTYAYSAKVKGVAGLKYKIAIETTGGVELASYTFTATGRWQWVYGYYTETSSTTRRLTVRKAAHASTAVFYIDGAQVEACAAGETVSTYIDGDQVGIVPNQFPPAFLWSGTPHASTSTRSGQTRAGGMVMRLDLYGFVLLSAIGLGGVTPNNISVPYVQLDGAQYERTQKPPRQFTLAGRWDAPTFPQLQRKMSDLGAVLDRDTIAQQQPLTLLYQGVDDCGRVFSDTARIICSYEGGLEGVTDNLHAEQASIVFQQWLPLLLNDAEIGVVPAAQQNVTNANAIIQRGALGTWSAMGTGASGATNWVYALVAANDGTIYAGGDFATMGGVANTVDIAAWNGSAWSALGTGSNGKVYTLALGPDGTLYAGGSFTSMDGVANTARIAKWNGSAWSALGTGAVGGDVNAIAVGPDGSVYATGTFTSMGGVANTLRIAKWNGSAWSALSTGLNSDGTAIIVALDGSVYVSGFFSTAGVTSATRIAKWNGSTFSALSTGLDNAAVTFAFGPDGSLYMGGAFTVAGGQNIRNVAKWNGSAFSSLGTNFFASIVYALAFAPDGSLWVGGLGFSFSFAGVVIENVVRWTGSSWVSVPIVLPGTTTVQAILAQKNGVVTLGFNQTGTAVVAGSATLTNTGTAKTYPQAVVRGPSSGTANVYQIVNETTGRAIYFNYTINAGETVTLTFSPDNLSFISNFQGNIYSKILSGSNVADFFLQPGANVITFYASDTTVSAVITARPACNALSDFTP